MIDLHTHSLLSDGDILPAELAYRAQFMKEIKVLAITDHIDFSNIEFVVPRLAKVCEVLNRNMDLVVIPGAELTHIPPAEIHTLTDRARALGARIVLVHGETIVETVPPDTNLAALQSNIDILAHPGLITEREAKLAKHNGILLEITARKGHCLTNGHIVKIAEKVGADLILNTDAHSSDELIDVERAEMIAKGAGADFSKMLENSKRLVEKVLR